MKFCQKLAQPGGFGHAIGHDVVLNFGARPGDGILPLGRPGNQIVTEEHRIARGGLASVGATSLLRIGVDLQLTPNIRMENQSQMKSALDI